MFRREPADGETLIVVVYKCRRCHDYFDSRTHRKRVRADEPWVFENVPLIEEHSCPRGKAIGFGDIVGLEGRDDPAI